MPKIKLKGNRPIRSIMSPSFQYDFRTSFSLTVDRPFTMIVVLSLTITEKADIISEIDSNIMTTALIGMLKAICKGIAKAMYTQLTNCMNYLILMRLVCRWNLQKDLPLFFMTSLPLESKLHKASRSDFNIFLLKASV